MVFYEAIAMNPFPALRSEDSILNEVRFAVVKLYKQLVTFTLTYSRVLKKIAARNPNKVEKPMISPPLK